MGSETKIQLPMIDFSGLDLEEKVGTHEWKLVRAQVMNALQEYSCFEAVYDKVSLELREAVFGDAVKELFSLPLETKMRNTSDKPNHGYMGQIPGFDFESLNIRDAPSLEGAQSFTDLMWPGGNPSFCKTVWAFSKQVTELEQMVRVMVLESFGIGKQYSSHIEATAYGLRLSEYGAPEMPEAKVALHAHTDPNMVSIICQHKVDGLEIRTKEGDWIHVTPTPNSFTVFFGEAFEAWSNGRLKAVWHRVVMQGNETRHITLLGSQPKDTHMVQAQQELVDEEHHLLFKPYYYPDYLRFRFSEAGREAKHMLKAFCGVGGDQEEVAA